MSRLGYLGWIAGLLLILLAGLLATISRPQAGQGIEPPLSAHSSAPSGALALYMWTQRLDRPVDYLEYRPFELGPDDAVLVSLEPFTRYTDLQVSRLRSWLRGGGTLLLATSTPTRALDALGLGLSATEEFSRAVPAQPALLSPPVSWVEARSSDALVFRRGLPVLRSDDPTPRPVLVSVPVGRGRAWMFSMPDAFSNALLGRADNWKLYLNVLADARPGRVLFDEYHHGLVEPRSLRELMLRSAWGWAILYGLAVLLAYVALRGRRLGRPVPATRALYRSSSEYVLGLAAMLQGARKPDYLSRHFEDVYRRTLRRASGLSPRASLEEMQRAAEERTGESAEELVRAVIELEQRPRKVRDILRIVRRAEPVRRKLVRSRRW